MDGLTFVPAKHLKEKYTDANKIGFGRIFTDYMFTMRYFDGAWQDARIEPYGDFALDPACMVFHYGQAIFEGMKAYPAADGSVNLFRAKDNFARMNSSARRMRIPEIDEGFVLKALEELIRVEKDWIPTAPDTSLYIRPTIIATDAHLGVKASSSYLFYIILSPVGPYYAGGLDPVKIYVEDEYVRAVKGGTGFTKAACNYATSLLAGELAKDKGYTQVLWLDGVHRKYIEEVGAMNIFFRFNDAVVTPMLQGSILPGITRDSVLRLLRKEGVKAEERLISAEEVFDRADRGELLEVFGSGTAAVISPVGVLRWEDRIITINGNKTGELSQHLYDELTGIQFSRRPDPFGWVTKI
ncbi:MAG: branched-chain amino acid aminotransferase [Christensenellales bacterium]|jgi:branched-chain amino acid aminotransferase